jgi:acyl carrier protein
MEISEIINDLNTIFRDELDNKNIVLNLETTANDIEEWDSLTHIQLVFAIEKRYKIRFNSMEIRNWKTVGELCAAIKTRVI